MKKPFQNNETVILIELAKIHLGTTPLGKISDLDFEDIDPQLLIEAGLRHGLLFIAYAVLNSHFQKKLPTELGLLKAIGSIYKTNATRNLFLSASLIKLLNLFQQNNICAVPFKGPVQALLLYEDIGLRSFSDLDILVKKNDAIKAKKLLCQKEFRQCTFIPEAQTTYFLNKENFFEFIASSGKINIDLHWELSGRYTKHPIYYPEDDQSLQEISFLGKTIQTLSPEDMLIHLCVHGSSHCWEKLEMIFSVAKIAQGPKPIDWEQVFSKAPRIGCCKMVLFGLILAKHYFGIGLPEIVKNSSEEKIYKNLLNDTLVKIDNSILPFAEQLSWRFSPFHFHIRDSFLDGLTYFSRLIFQPTIKEWELFSLPNRLLFLYHILRPYRLMKEGLTKKHA